MHIYRYEEQLLLLGLVSLNSVLWLLKLNSRGKTQLGRVPENFKQVCTVSSLLFII